VLDHLCRSAGPMLRSGFTAQRVAIDLTHIAHVDASSLASLEHACLRWANVGVRVTIEGCNRTVAEAIHRHGLRADVRRQPRVEDFVYATTLH
jgi:anti-anti-sigma regulatory factor